MTRTSKSGDLIGITMSPRQYAGLRMFTDDPRNPMDIDTSLLVDQRTFGSLFHKKWIKYSTPERGFVVTPLGIQAMALYESTSVIKETPSVRFSHYLDSIKSLAAFHNRSKGAAA